MADEEPVSSEEPVSDDVIELSCACGAVRGQLSGARPAHVLRVRCHCGSCQDFVRLLGRADGLDEEGGIRVGTMMRSEAVPFLGLSELFVAGAPGEAELTERLGGVAGRMNGPNGKLEELRLGLSSARLMAGWRLRGLHQPRPFVAPPLDEGASGLLADQLGS